MPDSSRPAGFARAAPPALEPGRPGGGGDAPGPGLRM